MHDKRLDELQKANSLMSQFDCYLRPFQYALTTRISRQANQQTIIRIQAYTSAGW
jgi:hypothetical protein